MDTPPSRSPTLEQPSRPLPPPNRRRDKPQLSCNLCRKRKLKCDRAQPCETCIKRGLSLSCTYMTYGGDQTRPKQNRPQRQSMYQGLVDKISQLESLLASQSTLAESRFSSSPKQDQDAGVIANSTNLIVQTPPSIDGDKDESLAKTIAGSGLMDVDDSKKGTTTTWVGTNHWAAILDGISELKASLNEDTCATDAMETSTMANLAQTGPQLLLDSSIFFTHQDILMAIPERRHVDRLVSTILSGSDLLPMLIHAPTFLDEYDHFWSHREETSLLWLAMLFGIMCLAMLQQEQTQQQFNPMADNQYELVAPYSEIRLMAYHYRTKAAQCLKLGNYLKPAPYLVPAILMYTMVESSLCRDAETGIWVLLGIALRLALRLGYHRDASDYPKISPFHGELRRRIWCFLQSMDSGTAAQFGLPSMLRNIHSTSKPPRNLFDEDLSVDMTELPPARPDSTRTPIQYFATKVRLVQIGSVVADLGHDEPFQPGQYDRVMEMDRQLQAFYAGIPSAFILRSMSKSLLDEPTLIFQRFHMAIVFYKTICVLHRPYMLKATLEPEKTQYAYSQTTCLQAAIEILDMQRILDEELQADGRLFTMRVKMSPMIQADFLFATVVLTAYLDNVLKKGSEPTFSSNLQERSIQSLRGAQIILHRHSNSSGEARQVHAAISVILGRIDGNESTSMGLPGELSFFLPHDLSDGANSMFALPSFMPSDIGQNHVTEALMMADLTFPIPFP